MKKLILMTILFLTLQSSGYINFKGAHFRKLEEGEHYYYILSISPLNKNERPYSMVAISDFFFLNRLSENDDCNDFVNKFYNYADYASEYTMGFYEIHSKKFIKTSEYMELYNQYLLVYSDEFSDIVYYLTDGTLVCVYSAVVKSPVYIADYHASSNFDKQKDIVIATRLLSKFSKYPHLIFGAFTQEDLPYFWKKLPEQTSDIDGIRIIETYNTECIRDVFSQLSLKFDPFWQSKINVTDYTFWIFIEISNDRIVLMDTNATSRQ